MIARETIQIILDTARIEEIISEFVKLKKRGQSYVGLCPFHQEKTPSFTVTPRRGIFKCFGCGKSGNVVSFLMEHEHYSYPEALKFLAKRYNIPIAEEEPTPEQKTEQQEKESLFVLNEFAAKYFTDYLFHTEEGRAIGLSYFKERGFREDTIKKFQLGYSPEAWNAFTSHALKHGFKPEHLEKTGLTLTKDNKSYDRFRGRVIFPIFNLSGRVLGFGARTLLSDKSIPKYINSPESEIYNKSQILYGIHLARTAIASKDNCYLVEGYTDVISLHQAGIENVVASSGTALTTEQIRLISRFTKNITILFDGDEAGIKASFRGIDMILEQGLNVKVVLFPDGEDPDSFVSKHRTSEVHDYITHQANDFITFKTRLLLKEVGNDPIKRAGLIKEIVGSIALIPDQIIRNLYLKECASIMDIPEQTLMNVLNQIRRKEFERKLREKHTNEESQALPEAPVIFTEKEPGADFNSTEHHEREIIRLLINYGDQPLKFETSSENQSEVTEIPAAIFIINDITKDEITFSNPVYQKIFDLTTRQVDEGVVPDAKFYLLHEDHLVAQLATNLLIQKHELCDWKKAKVTVRTEEENLSRTVTQALLSFKLRVLENKADALSKQIRQTPDPELVFPLLKQYKQITQVIAVISAELGRIVLR